MKPSSKTAYKIINRHRTKRADLIVGIPSYNEADNIAFVVKQADKGLKKNFKEMNAVIVNVDNDSADNTREAFLRTETSCPKIYVSTPPGVRGKGVNFYNLFGLTERLGARAVAVVDADLRSITPEWIKTLLLPVLDGYDYITPYYARNEYDGSITNHICFPLIYGLLGRDIRQPIGGDFSFSPRLAKYWLKRKWHKTTKKYGIDIFMTMHAITGGFRLAQAGLGAKVHKPSAPKLGPMFSQVVTTLFKIIIANKEKWSGSPEKKEVPYFGRREMEKPQNLSVDYKGMKSTSLFDFKMNEDILARGLSPQVFRSLKDMYGRGKVNIDAGLWSKIIYDAIYAYDGIDLNQGLIEALKPLYFGRFISFFKATLDKPFEFCERDIRRQAEIFWKNRGYLLKKYQANK